MSSQLPWPLFAVHQQFVTGFLMEPMASMDVEQSLMVADAFYAMLEGRLATHKVEAPHGGASFDASPVGHPDNNVKLYESE